ncbi:MAG: DNRLRE domain-containing protein [Planctomycetaceae bacterium]|nr:DNRLRE domain-containing protein [Planctomycetaceae bacterium]
MPPKRTRSSAPARARQIAANTAILFAALVAFIAFRSTFAAPHDGIEEGAERRQMPPFAILERATDYVRDVARRSAVGTATFSVIGLPDTQNYASDFPQIFTAQTNWVAANRSALDVRFVSHYGDIVNNADQAFQWANANASMSLLDGASIPYGVCPGNHDITSSGTPGQPYIPQNYLANFGPQRFAGEPWFGGSSPSGLSTYAYFSAGGVPFIHLHLDCETPVAELTWAQSVLDAHRDRPAMLTTHRYLQDAEDYTSGVPIVPSGRFPASWYAIEGLYNPNGIQAEDFFQWFIRRNANVFLVTCGHFHEEFRQTSTNVAGKPVHEVLADFQDDPNGGDGWLRIMRFDTFANTIDVDTYSPTLQAVRTAPESDFNLPVVFDDYRLAEGARFKAFQQGIAGYAGTQDTWINQDSPNTSYGNNDTRWVDDDTANSLFADYRGQGLVRFDGAIGANGVPAGSTIVKATLVLDIADDIDTPLFNPLFFVHPVIRSWDEGSTWNSLSGGLTVGADLLPAIGQFLGDNVPNSESMRRLDVTATVASWSAGAPNHGFAILPQIISGNDDGIEIWTSESGNPLLRPRLEVTYIPPTATNVADLDDDGFVAGSDLALLLAAWGTPSPTADLDDDGSVDAQDLAIMLSNWG